MSISYPIQSVLYAVGTKSIGSGFRVADDWNASPERLARTVTRESILLGLTTVSTTAIQVLFTKTVVPFLQRRPALNRFDLILRGLVTVPALIFAEWISRAMAPKDPPFPQRTVFPNTFSSFELSKTPSPGYYQGRIRPSATSHVNFYS